MKILKNELFIPIITCFLALVTFISLYSLPKAKASTDYYYYFDLLESRSDLDSNFEYHYSKLEKGNRFNINNKKIYFSESLDYYIVISLNDTFNLYINPVDSFSLSLEDCLSGHYLIIESFFPNTKYVGFSLVLEDFLIEYPSLSELKITNIKYFSRTTDEEVTSTNISIYISNVDSTSFTYVEAVEPTYYSDGNYAYYKCSCHYGKYFDENYFKLGDVTRDNLFKPTINFKTLETYDVDTSSFVPLEKGVDLRGKTFYFSKDDSTLYTEIYFKDFYLRLNSIFNIVNVIGFSNYYDYSLFIFPTNSSSHHMFAKFSFNDKLPADFDLVVQDIKYFLNENTEVDSVGYDILISPFAVHDFSEWVDEIPATETTTGVRGHYTCSHCSKYFDENYVEITNLVIPKISNSNSGNGSNSGSNNSTTSNGGSCTSASIYGIFGIAIVFSFVAFAISHITKRKKPKRK